MSILRGENRKRFLLTTFLLATCAEGNAAVQLGIDVLKQSDYAILHGKRVGLITNQTGVDSDGNRTRVLLRKNCNLVALYTPEHGLDGKERAGRYVKSRRDPLTGLIAYSLYGPTRKPTPSMLRGVDALVFDMQDIRWVATSPNIAHATLRQRVDPIATGARRFTGQHCRFLAKQCRELPQRVYAVSDLLTFTGLS